MSNSNETHSVLVGYILWLFGFTGSHRFYFGKPITGTIWFFTGGLLLIGWIIDVFLIPGMARRADIRYQDGPLGLHPGLDLLDVLGNLRHPPLLHGQVDHRLVLSAHGRPGRTRAAL